MKISDSILAFHYDPGETTREASLLTENLMRWGGRFRFFLHWVFETPSKVGQRKPLKSLSDFSVFTPDIPMNIRSFPLAAKIFAAAEAESLAEQAGAPLLIWLDPDSLIIHEPLDLLLKSNENIAISPVHLKNISCLVEQPLDEYWKTIYSHFNLKEGELFHITSMIDQKEIYPHFNAGLISVKPQLGILRQWKENFLSLYDTEKMKVFYETDRRCKLYIHQAVLAATILVLCKQAEIKLLPQTYNYPLHVASQQAAEQKPAVINDLITARYDDFSDPEWISALPCREPFKSWLNDAVSEIQLQSF